VNEIIKKRREKFLPKKSPSSKNYIKALILVILIAVLALPIFQLVSLALFYQYGSSTSAKIIVVREVPALNDGYGFLYYDGISIQYDYLVEDSNYTNWVQVTFNDLEQLGYGNLTPDDTIHIGYLKPFPKYSRIRKSK